MSMLFAFTGPEYSGRSTVILNLGYLLSKKKYKVLIIEADQRMCKLSTYLDTNDVTGLWLEDAVTGIDNRADYNFHIDKKTKISFLGNNPQVRCNQLVNISFNQAASFYKKIMPLYDFVFVDCGNFVYEALSAAAICAAEKTFVLISPDMRSEVWRQANCDAIGNISNKTEQITVNMHEMPEIAIESRHIFPYVQNMRDYTISHEIFAQNPTGKKAQEYMSALQDLAVAIKGDDK